MPLKPYLDISLSLELFSEDPTRCYHARIWSADECAEEIVEANELISNTELVKLQDWMTRSNLRRSISAEDGLSIAREIGAKLFRAVFRHSLRAFLDQRLEQTDHAVRLRLDLSKVPELIRMPWEFLYDAEAGNFLAQSQDLAIVRDLRLAPVKPLKIDNLEILVVTAEPFQDAELDIRKEVDELAVSVSDLTKRGIANLTVLQPKTNQSTWDALQHALRTKSYHVVHFIGHGYYDANLATGVLIFETSRRREARINGNALGALLHNQGVCLAVINSCVGAVTSADDPFSGVAQSLLRTGIPAVIGMQYEITDIAAIKFSSTFYLCLAEDYPVDAALAQARLAILGYGNHLEWATPVLYMRTVDGRLFFTSATERGSDKQISIDSVEREEVELTVKRASALAYTEIYEKAARGDADAQFELGLRYEVGEGIGQDARQAVEWYRKAAAQGVAAAQNNLGYAYDVGLGVEQDQPKAIEYYRMAADQGFVAAQYNLGYAYDHGRGVELDNGKAIEWYKKAAAQGSAPAQNNLGYAYRHGLGVERDDQQGVEWFRKAVAQGYAAAQNSLGYAYSLGLGVEQDLRQAVKLFRAAAAQGDAAAQCNLGYAYDRGRGVTQDSHQAEEWYRKAAAQGHVYALVALSKRGRADSSAQF